MRTLFASVTVYGQPGCTWCTKAKNQLDNAGVNYDYVDITQNPEAKSYIVDVLGARQVPVIVDDVHDPIIGTESLDDLIAYHTASETSL